MPKPILFITHRHRYSEDFWKLHHSLRESFLFSDQSVHDHRFEDDDLPLDFLEGTIAHRIKICNVFIAIGRRYLGRAPWCQWEIDKAIEYGKLVFTYSPHGLDPVQAPLSVRQYRGHAGHFTQARRLRTQLAAFGYDIVDP
jgi:hypothetical protein